MVGCITGDGSILFYTSNSGNADAAATVTERMRILQNGNVGIGTATPGFLLDVAGAVHATSFPTSSDMRFKTDIEPIDDALEKVLALNGVYFKWNHLNRDVLKRSDTKTRQVGLIVQQVQQVSPVIVSDGLTKEPGII